MTPGCIAVLAYDERDLAQWKDEHPELADAVMGISLTGYPLAVLQGARITSYTYTDGAVDHPEFLRVTEYADRLLRILNASRARAEANLFVRAAADSGTL